MRLPVFPPRGSGSASPTAVRRMFYTVGLTVGLGTLYFYLNSVGFWYVFPVYAAALAVFALVYLVYNRGLTRRNLTPEMLPTAWSEERKAAYIADGRERDRKSRWMLMIIFSLVVVFLLDFLYLWVSDMWKGTSV